MTKLQLLDAVPEFVRHVFKDSESCPGASVIKWSAPFDPPAIGATIRIRVNQIGLGKITGYASLDGWLGVMAYPLDPPAWWVRQNGAPDPGRSALVFGAEMALP